MSTQSLDQGYVDSEGQVWATAWTCAECIGFPSQGETSVQHLQGYYRWIGFFKD